MHQAWSDLSYIEHEQERYVALRSKTVSELDAVRQQAVALENVILTRITKAQGQWRSQDFLLGEGDMKIHCKVSHGTQ